MRTLLIAFLMAAVASTGLGSRPVSAVPAALTAASSAAQSIPAGHTVVEDFSAGVAAENHPLDAGQYKIWYDATDNAFATPSASTETGTPAMRIDDGGFTNGVYAIYEAAIPATGR